MHELAQRLHKVGDSLNHDPRTTGRSKERSAVRAAASSVDAAAVNLAAGHGQQSELADALSHAADAIVSTRNDDSCPMTTIAAEDVQ